MFAVTNPNLKPENVTENGVTYWKSTPTETSVTLNGTWFIVAGSDETVTISHSNGKTTVEMIITDGEPVYFSLDKSEEDANIPNGITSSKNNDSVNAYVSKASQSVVLNWGDETVSRIDIMNLYGQIIKSEPVKAGVKNANIFLGTNLGTCLMSVI